MIDEYTSISPWGGPASPFEIMCGDHIVINPEQANYNMVLVNRTESVIYPPGVQPYKPELHNAGPSSYSSNDMTYLCFVGRKMSGMQALQFLEDESLLGRCLGLPDGLAIVNNPTMVSGGFLQRGENNALFKSVAIGKDGRLCVPVVYRDFFDQIIINWLPLFENFTGVRVLILK